MTPDNGGSSDSIFRREGKALLETLRGNAKTRRGEREKEGEMVRDEAGRETERSAESSECVSAEGK